MRLLASMVLLGMTWQSVSADHVTVEEVVVVADKNSSRTFELAQTIDVEPDSAAILRKAVGANVVSNGPLTGIAQYRGMSRFRVNTQVNGMVISAGGPNWMDPPLSYAPAAHLEALQVIRGIASVSAGQETIGGVIKADTWRGTFSEDGVQVEGRLRSGMGSVNDAYLFSGAAAISNENQLLMLSGLQEGGNDAEFSGGEVLPSEYQRDRFDTAYGWRSGRHTFRFDYGVSNTGDAGTAALPMDIQYIDADLASMSWAFAGEDLQWSAKLHSSAIDHGMTNYHLRTAPPAGSMWRRNIATGENFGFALAGQIGGFKFGLDGHQELHDSDIDNPNNPTFFVTNFNNAERRVLGAFAEYTSSIADGWLLETGVRINQVNMDADAVDATPARMGMPPAMQLRDRFNAADRSQADVNVDWVIKANYWVSSDLTWYAGLSRKTRSPAYQERYLWLPLQATAGLADGRTYTGNINLDPEVAHEVEFGLDGQWGNLQVSPRLFYRDIEDYIQGVPSTNTAAFMFVQMMNMMNGTNNASPLMFTNTEATLYGFDVDWRYRFNDQWRVEGVLNYVRGERDDVADNLYRVAAPNMFVALHYSREDWGISLENFLYAEQNDVSASNSETASAGYGLVNLQGFVNLAPGLKLGLGVNNLADKKYADHLGGVNRVRGNPDVELGERLPGNGRSLFARLDYRW